MPRIVTHDGIFHADEVFAVAALQELFPAAELLRTRDLSVIANGDIVVDIGGVYAPENNRFDHHQPHMRFDCRRDNGVPYASFGLVWRSYGLDVCKKILRSPSAGVQATLDRLAAAHPEFRALPPEGEEMHRLAEALAQRIDLYLCEPVDAQDNGIFSNDNVFTVSAVITSYNPSWASVRPDMSADDAHEIGCAAFGAALGVAATLLHNLVVREFFALYGQDNVAAAFAKSRRDHGTQGRGAVVVLPLYMPWHGAAHNHTYVRYVVAQGLSGSYAAYAAPEGKGGGKLRKAFPAPWRGLTNAALAAASGVADALFCHKSGFMASAGSLDGAIKLAMLSDAYGKPPAQ